MKKCILYMKYLFYKYIIFYLVFLAIKQKLNMTKLTLIKTVKLKVKSKVIVGCNIILNLIICKHNRLYLLEFKCITVKKQFLFKYITILSESTYNTQISHNRIYLK